MSAAAGAGNARDSRVLSWDNLRRLVEAGVPAAEPIPGAPPLELFVEAAGSRIGLLAPVERVEAPPPNRLRRRPHTARGDARSSARRDLHCRTPALPRVPRVGRSHRGSHPVGRGVSADRYLGEPGSLAPACRHKRGSQRPTSDWGWSANSGCCVGCCMRRHGPQALDAWVGPVANRMICGSAKPRSR